MSKLKVNEIEPFSSTGIAIGGAPTVNPSAILDIQSTTQGILPPRMTTVQRNAILSPVEGLLVYNLDEGRLEQYTSGQWTITGNGQTPIFNVLRVIKNPVLNAGDFSSIAAAIATITSASSSNLYIVEVGPGIYTEPQINVPPYVFVTGLVMDAVIVQPDNNSHHIFTLSTNSGIEFLSLHNAGPGFAGMYISDAGDFVQVHKITIKDCDTGTWCRSVSKNCFTYLEYVNSVGGNTGIKVEANSGFTCYVNAENFYVYTSDPGNINPADGALVTGSGAKFICHASGYEGGTNTFGNAIRTNNGAFIDLKATSINSWSKGLYTENVGSAPSISVRGLGFSGNVADINISHPSTSGTINATAIADNSFFDPGTFNTLALFLSNPANGEIIASHSYQQRQIDNSFTDISTLAASSATMGILNSSGDISPPVSGFIITVDAATGYLQKSDGSLHKITWPDSNFTVSANTTTYLYFDVNGVLNGSPTIPNITENILMGRVVTDSSKIIIIEESGQISTHVGNAIGSALRDGLGAIYSDGSTVAEVGTRTLAVTAGKYYYGERKFLANGGSPVTFSSFYQNGVGGFITVPSITQVDNANWDNGTGTLTALGVGNYAKHSLYALGDSTGDFDSEAYFLVYSQAQYTSLTLAEQGNLPNSPSFLSEAIALIASIIVQQGTANIVEIRDERPLFSAKRVSSVAATTFHHNLLGLNDFDDHLRYLPVDGSRAMTADLPMGTHNIVNAGTYNSVTVENHHSRHQPGSGTDELPTAAAVTLNPDLSNTVGVSTSLSRADHIHNIPTATAIGLDTTSANTQGATTNFARADHTHAIASGTPSTQTPDQTNAAGVSTNFAKADHIHNIPTVAPSTQTPDAGNLDGIAASFSRSDHVHNIPTAIPIQTNADGFNLKGTSVNFARADHKHDILTGIPSTQVPDQANTSGSSSALARADHIHNIPTVAPSTQTPDQSNTDGSSANFSRADHIHNIPTAIAVGLNAGSTNTQGATTNFARADHTHAIASGTPSTQTPDQTNAAGVSTNFAKADHIHNIPTAVAATISTNANTQGTATTFARADHTHQLTVTSALLDQLPKYDGTNWQPIYQETASQARAYRYSEDWISATSNGTLGWTTVNTGGGSTATTGTTGVDSSHPGVLVLTAGNAAARISNVHLGPTTLILGGGAFNIECLFNLQTLTNAAFRLGLGDQTAADHNNGVYLEYNSGVSANWLIKTANSGTRTTTTTAVAATANTWHKLTITINAAASSVSYTLDGVNLGSITTNIPTAAIAPNLQSDSLAATNSTMWIDYYIFYQRFTSTR